MGWLPFSMYLYRMVSLVLYKCAPVLSKQPAREKKKDQAEKSLVHSGCLPSPFPPDSKNPHTIVSFREPALTYLAESAFPDPRLTKYQRINE